MLKQPDLNFLSALQKPENQVLQAGGIDQLVACPGSSLSLHREAPASLPFNQASKPASTARQGTHDGLRHDTLDFGRHGGCVVLLEAPTGKLKASNRTSMAACAAGRGSGTCGLGDVGA